MDRSEKAKEQTSAQNVRSETLGSSGGRLEECGREKYWKELTIVEQVERMRSIVKVYTSRLHELEDAMRSLDFHEHGASGRVVYPDRIRFTGGADASTQPTRDPEDIYF